MNDLTFSKSILGITLTKALTQKKKKKKKAVYINQNKIEKWKPNEKKDKTCR